MNNTVNYVDPLGLNWKYDICVTVCSVATVAAIAAAIHVTCGTILITFEVAGGIGTFIAPVTGISIGALCSTACEGLGFKP